MPLHFRIFPGAAQLRRSTARTGGLSMSATGAFSAHDQYRHIGQRQHLLRHTAEQHPYDAAAAS